FLAKLHQNFPSRAWKCVGLFNVTPPSRIQCAIHSIISAGLTVGGPKRLCALLASLSRAVEPSASDGSRIGSIPKWRQNSIARSRTERVSGPVMFNTKGGD